jgi:four helix bundle protein
MHKYQSLDAWKHAHSVVLTTLRVTTRATRDQWAIYDQLRRAAVSVEANIVEGYALGTAPLFRRHLRIALGSAAESECLVRMAGELGYFPAETFEMLERELDAAMGCLVGLMRRGVAHRR